MHSNPSAIFLALVLLIVLYVPSRSSAQTGEGRIVTTTGRVYVNGVLAKPGDVVAAGAKVETESGSTASIIFGSDSVVHLASTSVVNVDTVNGNAVSVSVLRGSVDGVKKMGASGTESIIVKTDSAVFELKSGRYVVGKNESSKSPATSYVAVDGDAVLTYTKDTKAGAKAGESVKLEVGSFVMVRPSSATSVATTTQVLGESKSNELRPSQKDTPTPSEVASNLTTAILNLAPSGDVPPSRGPAAESGGTTTPVSELGPLPTGPVDSGLPGAGTGSRDPLQPLPGKANPNVTVTFEP